MPKMQAANTSSENIDLYNHSLDFVFELPNFKSFNVELLNGLPI